MNVSAGAEDKGSWREPKDDTIQVGKQRLSRTEEVRHVASPITTFDLTRDQSAKLNSTQLAST